jgi:GT2 family glycosyltransferase
MATPARIRSVTIVAPMLDEARHVETFVADIAAQDFDGPLDLVVADGDSSDGSARLLQEAASRAGVQLTLLQNPERFVSHGLNRCIEAATGDLVVRLDCHSRYPADYVRLCVEASEETGAWNVGGVLVPRGTTATERAVAAAMDGPFGGIGWTRAGEGERVETDTVTFGAFRREAFEAAGGFDESLVRNQDDELNLRLRQAGGRVVLDPRIEVFYVPRGTLRGVFRQYFEYGRWKVRVMRKHRTALGARSLVPVAFVLSAVIGTALALWLEPVTYVVAAELALYLAAAIGFGIRSLRRRGEALRLLPRVIGAYLAFHVGYGAGMLRGLLG